MKEKITFKTSKVSLVLGIVLLIVMIPLWATFVSLFFMPEMNMVGAIIAILVGSMFLGLPT